MIPTQAQIEEFVLNLEALTQREVIRIKLSLADELAVTDSKVGGVPYIPRGCAAQKCRRQTAVYVGTNQL